MAKLYDWEFGLFERAWGRRGVACPDCVNESNHEPTLKSKACSKCLYFTKIISD